VAGRDDVRRSEDAVAASEHAVRDARAELDNLVRSKAAADAINAARNRLRDARDRLQRDRDAWRAAQNRPNLPIANRLESALTAARAEVWTAEAMIEKTRIRAPMKGSVLQVNAKVGELSAPQSELPLVLFGDITALRIKAELEERDVAKVKIGQKVFVRSEAYPGKDFDGTVSIIAPALGPPRMSVRTTRRANDVDVLEVTVDLAPGTPLLPGMRVDVFFRP
jgi:HlyD family secretion protein